MQSCLVEGSWDEVPDERRGRSAEKPGFPVGGMESRDVKTLFEAAAAFGAVAAVAEAYSACWTASSAETVRGDCLHSAHWDSLHFPENSRSEAYYSGFRSVATGSGAQVLLAAASRGDIHRDTAYLAAVEAGSACYRVHQLASVAGRLEGCRWSMAHAAAAWTDAIVGEQGCLVRPRLCCLDAVEMGVRQGKLAGREGGRSRARRGYYEGDFEGRSLLLFAASWMGFLGESRASHHLHLANNS